VNFLDFWENGYGVLSHSWALSNVATFDFEIILLIITLTILITVLDRRLKELRNQAIQEADDERINMALAISTYLFDQQRVTNVTVNQSLARALRDLLNSTESLEKTSKELNRTVKDIPSNREMLTEIKNIKNRIFKRELL
jgi:signal transduction histidine kinase